MNKIRQFWALLKFQITINPFIIFVLLPLGMFYFSPFMISTIGHHYQPSLESLLLTQNIWLAGMIGVLLLAPEVIQCGASNANWATGTEFLLTRAVDRHLVFRARSAFFYSLILAVPLIALLFTLKNPDLQIAEYNKISHQQVLHQIPGSIPAPADKVGKSETITIPNGKTLIEGWNIWLMLCSAIGAQVFVCLIYPLKYRRFIAFGTYLAVVVFPMFMLWNRLAHEVESLPTKETVFFAFVAHQPLFWFMTISAVLFGQLWCERRFSQFEQ